jgi:hypothetical protein
MHNERTRRSERKKLGRQGNKHLVVRPKAHYKNINVDGLIRGDSEDEGE